MTFLKIMFISLVLLLSSSCGDVADEMIEVHDLYNFDKLENPEKAIVKISDYEWIKTKSSKVYLARGTYWTPSTTDGNNAVREYNLTINYKQPYHPD